LLKADLLSTHLRQLSTQADFYVFATRGFIAEYPYARWILKEFNVASRERFK
jgi:hypothetical protein